MNEALARLDDRDLVSRSCAGEDAAFAALMTRHKQSLYRLIVAQVGDADEALDLLQETFIAAHGALRRFDADRSLRAWLARIALNKCRDRARRRRVRRFLTRILSIESAEQVPDTAANAETDAIDRQRLALAMAAIARLPATLREPLLLCTVDELSQSEAAEALGISVKAVETRIRRARAALAAEGQKP